MASAAGAFNAADLAEIMGFAGGAGGEVGGVGVPYPGLSNLASAFCPRDIGLEDGKLPESMNANVFALRVAWANEKCCPELLPFMGDKFVELCGSLRRQQADLDSMESVSPIASSIYQMDIERVRFLVAAYLRTRLRKIEKQYAYLLDRMHEENEAEIAMEENRKRRGRAGAAAGAAGEEARAEEAEEAIARSRRLFSAQERRYLKIYAGLRSEHLDAAVLSRFPDTGEEGEEDRVRFADDMKPSHLAHVFVRVREALEDLRVDETLGGETLLRVEEGQHVLMQYRILREAILAGRVFLS